MATMHLESFMPARCWIAPEIPSAMYSSGATTFPVCPTCRELHRHQMVYAVHTSMPSTKRAACTSEVIPMLSCLYRQGCVCSKSMS